MVGVLIPLPEKSIECLNVCLLVGGDVGRDHRRTKVLGCGAIAARSASLPVAGSMFRAKVTSVALCWVDGAFRLTQACLFSPRPHRRRAITTSSCVC